MMLDAVVDCRVKFARPRLKVVHSNFMMPCFGFLKGDKALSFWSFLKVEHHSGVELFNSSLTCEFIQVYLSLHRSKFTSNFPI